MAFAGWNFLRVFHQSIASLHMSCMRVKPVSAECSLKSNVISIPQNQPGLHVSGFESNWYDVSTIMILQPIHPYFFVSPSSMPRSDCEHEKEKKRKKELDREQQKNLYQQLYRESETFINSTRAKKATRANTHSHEIIRPARRRCCYLCREHECVCVLISGSTYTLWL